MAPLPPPFPDGLRHRPRPRRRPRRRLATLALLPVLLVPAPLWRVRTVQVDAPGVPAVTAAALAALEGTSPLLLDLAWVRRQVDAWPEVGEVQVQLELPGVLRVRALQAVAVACFASGRGWHGVTADGRTAGRLAVPHGPILEGFAADPAALRGGLAAAQRLAAALGGEVRSVRHILPDDLELTLQMPGAPAPLVLHVLPGGGASERRYAELVRAGSLPAAGWADLRLPDRLVIGGGAA